MARSVMCSMTYRLFIALCAVLLVGLVRTSCGAETQRAAEIGRLIFLDTNLSSPVGQGCVSCHQPHAAFADVRPVSPGAVDGKFGKRNAPSLMYAALIPSLAYEDFLTPDGEEVYVWEGGLFHDGRARDLFEQVQQPFFDANEMNLKDESDLASRIRRAGYADLFRKWVGEKIWNDDKQLTYHVYRSLVEFLKHPMFRPFDARIDDFLAGDKQALSEQEKRGLEVFRGAGKCADCHLLEATTWDKPLLSDFGYDNLGVPTKGGTKGQLKDSGLGGRTKEKAEIGQFRAPSLRNVALTAPYMHNGSIATLKDVMDFYNKRDVDLARWGKTEFLGTVNREDMGDLKLTDQQVNDLVAFMDAFTDRTLLEMKRSKRNFPVALKRTPSTVAKRLLFPDWTHRLHPSFPGKPDVE